MTDIKDPGEKTLRVAKTLTLKRSVEQGVVRQSFSHGRSKAVVVEKVKRRVLGPEPKSEAASAPKRAAAPAAAPAKGAAAPQPAAPAAAPRSQPGPSGVVLRTLSEEERSARAHALSDARVRGAERSEED